MSTLKVIFDFVLSVVKVFFPEKKNGRHCCTDHAVPEHHCPGRPAPEADGSGTGSSRSHPLDNEAGETATDTPAQQPTTDRLMGHALIVAAIAGYLYKMIHY